MQIDMFGASQSKDAGMAVPAIPSKKPPFIPVQTMALDDRDVKNNFMYMVRILLNSHQRNLSSAKARDLYLETLVQEMKIKKGLIDPIIAVRTGALSSFNKN